MLQNSKCRLCGNRDKMINHTSKLAQREYKTRYDWVGKVIYWELCKTFKFDHANKWYFHNPEFVKENKAHKVLWNFEMEKDHIISS